MRKQTYHAVALTFAIVFSLATLFDRPLEAAYLFKSAILASILYAGTPEEKR